MPAVMVTSLTEATTVRLITVKMAIVRIARDLTVRAVSVCSVHTAVTVLTVRASILTPRTTTVRNARMARTVLIVRASMQMPRIQVVRNVRMGMHRESVRHVRALTRIRNTVTVRSVRMALVRNVRATTMPKAMTVRSNVRMEQIVRSVRALIRMPRTATVRNVRVSMRVQASNRVDMVSSKAATVVVRPITIRMPSTARRNR